MGKGEERWETAWFLGNAGGVKRVGLVRPSCRGISNGFQKSNLLEGKRRVHVGQNSARAEEKGREGVNVCSSKRKKSVSKCGSREFN